MDNPENLPTTPAVTETPQEPQAPATPAGDPPANPAEPQPVDVAALQAELEAERQAREAAETKFSQSTREAQILTAKVQGYEQRESFTNQPSEDDLRKAFPTWDYMTDTEKDIAKGTYLARKDAAEAVSEKRQREERAAWNRSVDEFTLTDQRLAGREEEFKKFASKPTRIGVDLSVLASAFLFETPEPAKAPPAPGLETGSGGTREPAPKKWKASDVAALQKNNPKEYHRLITTGKLNPDDIADD